MISRDLAPVIKASKKSVLLLGPRQTGKSTLISQLKPDISINLAREASYLEFLRNPLELEERLEALSKPATVFIDEIQRLPSLLNSVQVLLDHSPRRFKFYLTGSSARKLKRGHANLLPGRIHVYFLGPLSCGELGFQLDERKALSRGSLPGIWTDDNRASAEKTLRSYASTYLKEEVQAESLARNLEGFARFLYAAAERSGQFLDFSKLASNAQIPRQSAVRFFEVLEDCLLVRRADPFGKSPTRRLVQHPRFYFFDGGVLNGLLGNFESSQDRVGSLFEHLVFNQILNEASAKDQDVRVSSYRTEHGAEVDLILERGSETWAIEVKASRSVRTQDLSGLGSFRDYLGKSVRARILYLGKTRKNINGVEVLPWQEGIAEIFG